MPRVSVIIPTYNRAEYIADAIRSVQAQTYTDYEIIVADDGSTDNTVEIVAQFPDVRFVPLTHQGTPAATRNRSVPYAKGDLIAFLDSDDLFLPEKLQRQVTILVANPACAVVYSDAFCFDQDPSQPVRNLLAGLETPSGWVFAHLLERNFVTVSCTLVKKTVFEEMGGFDEDPKLLVCEDYDLWLRIATKYEYQFVAGTHTAYRLHQGNVSGDLLKTKIGFLRVFEKIKRSHPELVEKYTAEYTDALIRHRGGLFVSQLRQRKWADSAASAFALTVLMAQNPWATIQSAKNWRKTMKQRS